MFGHQVINYFKGLQFQDKLYSNMTNKLVDGIRKAQHFHLGDRYKFTSSDFFDKFQDGKTELFLGQLGENIMLPYDCCWFDFIETYPKSHPLPEEEKATKRGMLVQNVSKMKNCFWVINAFYRKASNRWELSPLFYYITPGKLICNDNSFVNNIVYQTNVDFETAKKHARILGAITPMPTSYAAGELPHEFTKIMREDMPELTILNFVLLLLCCKNIIIKNNYPENKGFKSKTSKKKFKYKTLKVRLPSQRSSTNKKQKQFNIVPLHLCRGHFKTFTKRKPLFGKYVGRYFWQPQLRGNKDLGVIQKEYKIKPNNMSI